MNPSNSAQMCFRVVVAAALCSISPGLAQTAGEATVDRVLPFLHLSDPQSLTEAATVIRLTGEIRQVNPEVSSRTLVVQGTSA